MARKPGKEFRISGSIIDQNTLKGAAGLRIEAWDKDLIFDDFVGSAVTDNRGVFVIEFNRSHFEGLFLDRQPDLYFKVFDGEELIKSTEDSVLWNIKAAEQTVEIFVGIETPTDPEAPQPAPASPTIEKIASDLQLPLPGELLDALKERGIRTLEDIRKAGGIGSLPNLPVPADDPAIRTLDTPLVRNKDWTWYS